MWDGCILKSCYYNTSSLHIVKCHLKLICLLFLLLFSIFYLLSLICHCFSISISLPFPAINSLPYPLLLLLLSTTILLYHLSMCTPLSLLLSPSQASLFLIFLHLLYNNYHFLPNSLLLFYSLFCFLNSPTLSLLSFSRFICSSYSTTTFFSIVNPPTSHNLLLPTSRHPHKRKFTYISVIILYLLIDIFAAHRSIVDNF